MLCVNALRYGRGNKSSTVHESVPSTRNCSHISPTNFVRKKLPKLCVKHLPKAEWSLDSSYLDVPYLLRASVWGLVPPPHSPPQRGLLAIDAVCLFLLDNIVTGGRAAWDGGDAWVRGRGAWGWGRGAWGGLALGVSGKWGGLSAWYQALGSWCLGFLALGTPHCGGYFPSTGTQALYLTMGITTGGRSLCD